MTRKRNSGKGAQVSVDDGTLREILGYLNFSNGTPDLSFQRNVNKLYALLGGEPPRAAVQDTLSRQLEALRKSGAAFKDSQQAGAVLRLVFDLVLPAYWRHHADLLFPIEEGDVPEALFLARVCEAVLEQGPPWDEEDRIVSGALARLNDYVGYRPVAVLENDRRMELYPHEKYRPIPLYLKDVGAAAGRYEKLIERTIAFFRQTPAEVLHASHFDLEQLQELALDIRAHDHMHPATKRTNYTFGEWDPYQIDSRGRYRRFVIRKIILDALLDWIEASRGVDPEELLDDASAVLCGTMLMASSISGSGPDTHDSTVSLTSLLPGVARQRDAFYARLLSEATGARAKRLMREAKLTQQPFGHVRQHLNIMLARYGARQVQYRHLAQLFARLGDRADSQAQAAVIPSPAARFDTEIRWRIAAAHSELDRGNLDDGVSLLRETIDLLKRGIACGAIVDPWNILGFQGLFPLFSCRDDSIPDHRVLNLLEIMERQFGLFTHAMSEAAAQNREELIAQLSDEFRKLAEWWDRHATTAVEDLPAVSGRESWESGVRVAKTLLEWRSAGSAAGDISFWRMHVGEFESAKAYAHVVDALLRKQDHVAAMGLLIQWLSRAEEVGLESGPDSIHAQLQRWMSLVTSSEGTRSQASSAWGTVRRLFDYLEANAGTFWNVPSFDEALGAADIVYGEVDNDFDDDEERLFADADEEDDDEDDSDLFEAAYDNVVFRDSAKDGHVDDTIDGGFGQGNSEMEFLARYLEPRLKFFDTLARLWQTAAAHLTARWGEWPNDGAPHDGEAVRNSVGDPHVFEAIETWRQRAHELEESLFKLCTKLSQHDLSLPSGDHDSNVEFDLQQQTKLYLQHSILTTQVRLRRAERYLRCCLPAELSEANLDPQETRVVRVYRGILTGDVAAVRRTLPELVDGLARSPLLYVAFEHGGKPDSMRDVRMRQSVIRFLLTHLPRLGFLRETWELLQTAYKMERESRPEGVAVTEFDQLFRTALQNTLRSVVRSSVHWQPARILRRRRPLLRRRSHYPRPAFRRQSQRRGSQTAGRRAALRRRGRGPQTLTRHSAMRSVGASGPPAQHPGTGQFPVARRVALARAVPLHRKSKSRSFKSVPLRDQLLIESMNEIIENYLALWLKHSRTMRLSSVEELNQASVWRDVKKFIESYGADLFHARMLTLGNIRTILHGGVERFLDYLDENRDPLRPIKLVEDLDSGAVDADHAAACLEIIYESLIDKFDRFVEYNTTTTQSDYGEMIYSLLDFLRVESAYDRDAWNLIPVQIAHEVLTELARNDAALIWESLLATRSAELAERHEKALARLEKKYGMRLPAISDHLGERFVKPMAVNRMTALVPRILRDARRGGTSLSLAMLRDEINAYLESTSGSCIDIPGWLRSLERAIDQAEQSSAGTENGEPSPNLPMILLSWNQTRRQLRHWK